MSKRTLVKTDDPENKKFTLVVKGMVEKKSLVDPEALYLDGKPGDTLESTITITPSKKDPFSKLDIDQNPDSNLKAVIVPPEKDEDPWKVLVTVQSEKVMHVYETLTIKTDSVQEPEINIKVSANFSKGS